MAGPLVLVLRHHEAAWRSWAVALDARHGPPAGIIEGESVLKQAITGIPMLKNRPCPRSPEFTIMLELTPQEERSSRPSRAA
jgi:hypothetical protein